MDRRKFVGTAAAASGILLLKPKTVFGYEANSAVRVALLGCGSRGTSVAESFLNNTSARFVALAVVGDLAALAALATLISAVAAWRLGWWGAGAWGVVRRVWFSRIAAGSAVRLAVLWSLNLIGAHLP